MVSKAVYAGIAIAVIIPLAIFAVYSTTIEPEPADVQDVTPAEEPKIFVLSSFYPIEQFVSNVGGDRIESALVLPPGAEPHDWEPTVRDVQDMRRADVVVINGGGFETWVESLHDVGFEGVLVDTSKGIELMEAVEGAHAHGDEDDDDHGMEAKDDHDDDDDDHGMEAMDDDDHGMEAMDDDDHGMEAMDDDDHGMEAMDDDDHGMEAMDDDDHGMEAMDDDDHGMEAMDDDDHGMEAMDDDDHGMEAMDDDDHGMEAMDDDDHGMEAMDDDDHGMEAMDDDDHGMEAKEDDDHGDDDDHHEDELLGDPHIWLNPVLVQIQVQNIADGLSEADPENADYYQENADRYIAELQQLDSDIRTGLESCSREFVAFHQAFTYFTLEYDLVQHTILKSATPHSDVAPGTLRDVIETARAQGIDVIFTEEAVDPRTAQIVADEIGGRVMILSPLEIGEPGETYISKMYQNLENLQVALCQDQ